MPRYMQRLQSHIQKRKVGFPLMLLCIFQCRHFFNILCVTSAHKYYGCTGLRHHILRFYTICIIVLSHTYTFMMMDLWQFFYQVLVTRRSQDLGEKQFGNQRRPMVKLVELTVHRNSSLVFTRCSLFPTLFLV